MNNYAIILAGGSGTRFWPLSRKGLPKQFLCLVGRDTFFEATVKRAAQVVPQRNIFIMTNAACLAQIKNQLRKFSIPAANLILEPKPLNTLPAILLGTRIIGLKDAQANILVLPADQLIKDVSGFSGALRKCLAFASRGFISLVGIAPQDACAGYGYIKAGKSLGRDVFRVASFVEKPDQATATRLIKKKDIFWNAGIFCFKAEVLLSETKRIMPDLYSKFMRIKSRQDISRIWPAIKPVSIDYGIMEESGKTCFIRGRFYWRDLGTWDALLSVLPRDNSGNAVMSDCILLNTEGSLACSYGSRRLIAGVGLKDVLIVDTPDALLVCSKSAAQQIRQLVDLLHTHGKTCI